MLLSTVLFDFLYWNDKVYLSAKTDFTDMILEMFGAASNHIRKKSADEFVSLISFNIWKEFAGMCSQ